MSNLPDGCRWTSDMDYYDSKRTEDTELNTQRDGAWMQTHGEWAADASELSMNPARRCPECGERLLTLDTLLEVRDQEGEITLWTGKHACGAKLTIFND